MDRIVKCFMGKKREVNSKMPQNITTASSHEGISTSGIEVLGRRSTASVMTYDSSTCIDRAVRTSIEYTNRNAKAHKRAIEIVSAVIPEFRGNPDIALIRECNYILNRNNELLTYIAEVGETDFQIIHNNIRISEMTYIMHERLKRLTSRRSMDGDIFGQITNDYTTAIERNNEILGMRSVENGKEYMRCVIEKNKYEFGLVKKGTSQ